MSVPASVPIVDLSASPEEIAATIRDACTNHGFFCVANHGVPAEIVKGMFDSSKSFFNLPVEIKRTVLQAGLRSST
jgi:isopenicillin N synthase-like dioxygenase